MHINDDNHVDQAREVIFILLVLLLLPSLLLYVYNIQCISCSIHKHTHYTYIYIYIYTYVICDDDIVDQAREAARACLVRRGNLHTLY